MTDDARKASYADLMVFPEKTRAEVIDGRVYVQPSARAEHNAIIAELQWQGRSSGISGPAGGWWFLSDTDTRLTAHDIVRPDLEGWRKERMRQRPTGRPIELRPDWICEVLSPSNARYDRQRKMDLYARAGIPFAWLVDPAERTLEAHALHDGRWLRLGAWGDGDVARVAPFEEMALDVGALFGPEPEVAQEGAAAGG